LKLELERELERLQRGGTGGGECRRERELDEKVEERETRELRRRRVGGGTMLR
jgi:hypothetical protein